MKILLTGDWHLRWKRPEMRLDENYFETQSGKVQQILNIAEHYGCQTILQPGDFFDGVETPWFVVQHYIKMFQEKDELGIFCSPGQHDLRYHIREIENTPLGVLNAAGLVELGQLNILVHKPFSDYKEVTVNSVWWGESDIPKSSPDSINILLMHKMVIQKKLWLGQTDFVYARDLLKNYPDFDLFVTGDNHQAFVEEYKGRYAVNCGSLMRSGIDQVKHVPRVYIYDTEKRSLEEVFLQVKSAEQVLDIDKAQVQKERDEKVELFISTLKKSTAEKTGYDFVDRLYAMMDSESVSQNIRNIVEEVLRK